jgi:hypothetical protein
VFWRVNSAEFAEFLENTRISRILAKFQEFHEISAFYVNPFLGGNDLPEHLVFPRLE